jgi:hypothetical protein
MLDAAGYESRLPEGEYRASGTRKKQKGVHFCTLSVTQK